MFFYKEIKPALAAVGDPQGRVLYVCCPGGFMLYNNRGILCCVNAPEACPAGLPLNGEFGKGTFIDDKYYSSRDYYKVN